MGKPPARGRFPLWVHGAETDPPGAKLDPISPVPEKVDANKAGELAAAGLGFGVGGVEWGEGSESLRYFSISITYLD